MKGGYFFTVCQKYDAPFILCMGTGANGYEERHIKNKWTASASREGALRKREKDRKSTAKKLKNEIQAKTK